MASSTPTGGRVDQWFRQQLTDVDVNKSNSLSVVGRCWEWMLNVVVLGGKFQKPVLFGDRSRCGPGVPAEDVLFAEKCPGGPPWQV